MFYKNYCLLLLGIALTIVNAKVTFKVIAVDGTPSVIINNKKYAMKLLEYPVYQAVVNVNPPVQYHYSLTVGGKTQVENFTRKATTSITLNEFFGRSITVKKHPLLPKVYETPSTVKQSKLYDDTHVSTILINAKDSDINKLHNNPTKEGLKYKVEVIYVNPYTVKKFSNAKLAISGQSSTHAKKLSYKISGLKNDDNKELYGRSGIKLRAEHMDPSYLREKVYGDILNSLGVPTIQNKLTRLYINKKPIGLFDMTDDINNGHFLKNTFNGGEKYTVDNAVFKADYWPDGGCWGDLGYYGQTSKMYDIYYYKGEKEEYDNDDMFNDILLPFIKQIHNYPKQNFSFDVQNFLKQMAVEYAAGGMDNYWLRPGNYYIFKDMKRNHWSFIDCDFHFSLGLSGNDNTDKLINYSIAKYTNYNTKLKTSSRPLLDNIRKNKNNENYFMNVFKNLIKYSFNIHALGPRIDSLADLIREDVKWDVSLPKVSGLKNAKDNKYTFKHFEAQVKNTSIAKNTHELFPLKYWIMARSEMMAKQLNISVPKSLVKSSLGFFECNYDSVKDSTSSAEKKNTTKKNKTNAPISKTTTSTKTNTTTNNNTNNNNIKISTDKDGRCGANYGKCPNNECCSQYGYCGTKDDYCKAGCQSQFGKCNNSGTSNKKTTVKAAPKNNKTTAKVATKKVGVSTVSGRCGANFGKCPNNECCSQYGYCGTKDDYCKAGCQSQFGRCNNSGTSNKKTTAKVNTKNNKTAAAKKVNVSTVSDRCGANFGKCANKNECCSQYGYCGKTSAYCGTGCQPKYGLCK